MSAHIAELEQSVYIEDGENCTLRHCTKKKNAKIFTTRLSAKNAIDKYRDARCQQFVNARVLDVSPAFISKHLPIIRY